MDGENNGKPYWNGWFGGTTIFGNIHITYVTYVLYLVFNVFVCLTARGWSWLASPCITLPRFLFSFFVLWFLHGNFLPVKGLLIVIFYFQNILHPILKTHRWKVSETQSCKGYKTQAGNVTHFTSLDVQYGSMAGCWAKTHCISMVFKLNIHFIRPKGRNVACWHILLASHGHKQTGHETDFRRQKTNTFILCKSFFSFGSCMPQGFVVLVYLSEPPKKRQSGIRKCSSTRQRKDDSKFSTLSLCHASYHNKKNSIKFGDSLSLMISHHQTNLFNHSNFLLYGRH